MKSYDKAVQENYELKLKLMSQDKTEAETVVKNILGKISTSTISNNNSTSGGYTMVTVEVSGIAQKGAFLIDFQGNLLKGEGQLVVGSSLIS